MLELWSTHSMPWIASGLVFNAQGLNAEASEIMGAIPEVVQLSGGHDRDTPLYARNHSGELRHGTCALASALPPSLLNCSSVTAPAPIPCRPRGLDPEIGPCET